MSEFGNTLSYEGRVDLFVEKKNKTIHLATFNEGMEGISELFTRACLGYPLANWLPAFVDLTTSEGESVLHAPVQVRGASYGEMVDYADEDGTKWKFPSFDAFIITSDIHTVLTSGDYYCVLLSAGGHKLARVKLGIDAGDAGTVTFSPILTLNSGNNILIRWSLFITNKEA